MTNHPSPAETRAICQRLLSPRPRCHYCATRAEQPGQFAALSAGWDTRPGPNGVAWWRCAACRAEDEGAQGKVLVVPVRVEAPGEWRSTVALCAYTVALLGGVVVLAWLLERLPPGIAAVGAAVGTVAVVVGLLGPRRGR